MLTYFINLYADIKWDMAFNKCRQLSSQWIIKGPLLLSMEELQDFQESIRLAERYKVGRAYTGPLRNSANRAITSINRLAQRLNDLERKRHSPSRLYDWQVEKQHHLERLIDDILWWGDFLDRQIVESGPARLDFQAVQAELQGFLEAVQELEISSWGWPDANSA